MYIRSTRATPSSFPGSTRRRSATWTRCQPSRCGRSPDASAAPARRAYRIGELAAKVGLTERTIRYYEERGLLESVKRLDGGQRVYTDDDVRRLKFIQKLKMLGLSLAEMQELETLYGRHHTNAKVLPRLIELLDSHLV